MQQGRPQFIIVHVVSNFVCQILNQLKNNPLTFITINPLINRLHFAALINILNHIFNWKFHAHVFQ